MILCKNGSLLTKEYVIVLKRVLFAVLFLFQTHCTTMNKNYQSKYGADTRRFCKNIFMDSKIKSLSQDERKYRYNYCLLHSTIKNVDQERMNTWISIVVGIYTATLIIALLSLSSQQTSSRIHSDIQ